MREMANYKVIVTARSFGNTDRKAYDLLEAAGCTVKKLVALIEKPKTTGVEIQCVPVTLEKGRSVKNLVENP